jgi:multidrug efflux pump subunit AcrB
MARILFVGLVAYTPRPVATLPQVDLKTIQVSASLPCPRSETTACSVKQPLERQFAHVPAIPLMTSTSPPGSAAITIRFNLDRIDGAANDMQAAINAAGSLLPKSLHPLTRVHNFHKFNLGPAVRPRRFRVFYTIY